MEPAQTKPVYCMDTSSFIRGWNEAYPIEVFPSFWDKLDMLASNSRIIAPDEVLRETKRRDDGLHDWLRAREWIFHSIDDELQVSVAKVMTDFQYMVKNRHGKNAADPWVVALARIVDNAIVVTEENEDDARNNPKIPLVCKHYDIEFVRLLDLIRMEAWKF